MIYDKLLTELIGSIFQYFVELLQQNATEFKYISLWKVCLWLVNFVLEQCKGTGGVFAMHSIDF